MLFNEINDYYTRENHEKWLKEMKYKIYNYKQVMNELVFKTTELKCGLDDPFNNRENISINDYRIVHFNQYIIPTHTLKCETKYPSQMIQWDLYPIDLVNWIIDNYDNQTDKYKNEYKYIKPFPNKRIITH